MWNLESLDILENVPSIAHGDVLGPCLMQSDPLEMKLFGTTPSLGTDMLMVDYWLVAIISSAFCGKTDKRGLQLHL